MKENERERENKDLCLRLNREGYSVTVSEEESKRK